MVALGYAWLITFQESVVGKRYHTQSEISDSEFIIRITRETDCLIPSTDLFDWVNNQKPQYGQVVSVSKTSIDGLPAVIEVIQDAQGQEFQKYYVTRSDGILSIYGGPLSTEYIPTWKYVIETIRINAEITTSFAYSSNVSKVVDVAYIQLNDYKEYLLPFEGSTIVTCGPFCPTGTHVGESAEALDFALPFGTPVYPTKPGKVITASYGWNEGAGNYVQVMHFDGTISSYMHLSEVLVTTDDPVSLSSVLGKVGNTGKVIPSPTIENPLAGTHLHFQVTSTDHEPIILSHLVKWITGCPPCTFGNAEGLPRSIIYEPSLPSSLLDEISQPVPQTEDLFSDGTVYDMCNAVSLVGSCNDDCDMISFPIEWFIDGFPVGSTNKDDQITIWVTEGNHTISWCYASGLCHDNENFVADCD